MFSTKVKLLNLAISGFGFPRALDYSPKIFEGHGWIVVVSDNVREVELTVQTKYNKLKTWAEAFENFLTMSRRSSSQPKPMKEKILKTKRLYFSRFDLQ